MDTVQREPKKPIANFFVTREPRYRYDERLKRPVRTADTYHIAMDDPLTPEDPRQIKSNRSMYRFGRSVIGNGNNIPESAVTN
ncbi:MAG: hypothetical protein KAV87_14210 [Desulfobacteraceae bacterium]|nr:hypothetical protein [Desulfobacteraceae bacterium]